ncbi:MAG TPA: hypothetical protein VMQ67_06550 [Candidatus Saccharimonadales bacterium]|nr:hypothetical protein [Candidatus Saccharimonadales bacterium]
MNCKFSKRMTFDDPESLPKPVDGPGSAGVTKSKLATVTQSLLFVIRGAIITRAESFLLEIIIAREYDSRAGGGKENPVESTGPGDGTFSSQSGKVAPTLPPSFGQRGEQTR